MVVDTQCLQEGGDMAAHFLHSLDGYLVIDVLVGSQSLQQPDQLLLVSGLDYRKHGEYVSPRAGR